MAFISTFWAAYLPVGVVLVAAVIELVSNARKRRPPPPSPDKREDAPARAVVFYMAWPRVSAARGRNVPVGAVSGRVISLQEARRRRSLIAGQSGTQRSRAAGADSRETLGKVR
jgi:uncharacterized membrane protein